MLFLKMCKRNQITSNKTIKSLSDTHLNCKIETIKSILENLSTVIKTLLEIDQTDVYSSSETSLLLHCITLSLYFPFKFKGHLRLNQFIEFVLAINK